MRIPKTVGLLVSVAFLVAICGAIAAAGSLSRPSAAAAPQPGAAGDYVVLAWNDLGMHCYNPSFDEIGVLPPWNTLWAQVVRVGDPPQIVTSGITVTYTFTDNTTSVSKSNFWDPSPYTTGQNAELLFGLAGPLAPDIGLTGIGLSGTMHVDGDHFVAEGIPLTEYRDSDPGTPYPYQLATIVVHEAGSGDELARAIVVAPVSTEMHCENCHDDGGPGNEDYATGIVELNILYQHDDENHEEYPEGYGLLVDRMPVLCADCHASAPLNRDGVDGIPSLSEAIHDKHKEKVSSTLDGCYNCHPGPQTQCLRDVMYTEHDMDCVSCHGPMKDVSENPEPWFNEPRCDDAGCHQRLPAGSGPLPTVRRAWGRVLCRLSRQPTRHRPQRRAQRCPQICRLAGARRPAGYLYRVPRFLTAGTRPPWHDRSNHR